MPCFSWVGVSYLRYTVLTSPKKGEAGVYCCDPALSVLVMLVYRFSRSISLAVYYLKHFLADQISCRSLAISQLFVGH